MRTLQRRFAKMDNVEANCKSPRHERLQALLAVGDRRIASVMLSMALENTDLRTALERAGLIWISISTDSDDAMKCYRGGSSTMG